MLFYQPGDGQFGEVLVAEISKNDYKRFNRLAIFVAYAKHSGVSRIAEALEFFIAAGGHVVAVVGVDQRHTTIEALELLRALGATVYVFYDEDQSRTFHPKAYWLRTETSDQWAAIGSNNLTAGGLYLNYEMAVIGSEPADSEAGAKIAATLSQLFDVHHPDNAGLLKPLDDALLADLKAKGYILTEQEAKDRERTATAKSGAGNGTQAAPIFGRSKKPALPTVPKKFALPASAQPVPGANATIPVASAPAASVASTQTTPPTVPAAPVAPVAPTQATPAPATAPAAPTPVSPPVVAVGSPKGFWKRLSNWDVNPGSSPGQMIIPLMFQPLFPTLGPSSPMASGGTQADVNFDVEYRAPGSAPKLVKNARLIAYTPAPNHPRKNIDLRFTFHDKGIDATLNAGDVLEFIRTGLSSPVFVVTKKAASVGGKKFDVIP